MLSIIEDGNPLVYGRKLLNGRYGVAILPERQTCSMLACMTAPTPKVQLTLRVTEERHRKVKKLSAAAGVDMATWLSALIDKCADPDATQGREGPNN